MILEPKVNDASLGIYKARLLDYSIGPPAYSAGYISPPGKAFPTLLKARIGMRPITLTLDFEGDSSREIARAVSGFSAVMMGGPDIQLPDGYHYWCVYDGQDAQKRMAPWIEQVKYSLHGIRHDPLETVTLLASGTIEVEGNQSTPAIITLNPVGGASSMSFNGITVRRSAVTIIDGVKTTVHDGSGNNVFGSTNITEWPKLGPGENVIVLDGCTALISYYPIYL